MATATATRPKTTSTKAGKSEPALNGTANKRKVKTQKVTPSMDYVLCRAEGHSWQHSQSIDFIDGRTIQRTSMCMHCGTTRYHRIRKDGTRLPAKYKYADGYLKEPGTVALKPVQWRKLSAEQIWRARSN